MSDDRHGTFAGLGERFLVRRGYTRRFQLNWPAGCVSSLISNQWVLRLPATFGTFQKVVTFKAYFFSWTSSNYRAGEIFEDFYIEDYVSGVRSSPEPMTLRIVVDPITRVEALFMDVGFWTDTYTIDLPPSPTTYWAVPG
jgi:hypothetical protein